MARGGGGGTPPPPRATSTSTCRSAPSAATTASSIGAGGSRRPRPAPGRRAGVGPPPAEPVGPDARERLFDRFVAAVRAEWRASASARRAPPRDGVHGRRHAVAARAGAARAAAGAARAAPHAARRGHRRDQPRGRHAAFAAWAAARRLRVSLGVQSFDARLRAALGRRGDADPAAAMPPAAPRPASGAAGRRRPGAPGLGVDLIFGLPGQQAADIEAELATVARLRPDHVSFYELSWRPARCSAPRVAADRRRAPGLGRARAARRRDRGR